MKNGKQREIRRYVPSGTVYVFEKKKEESYQEITDLITREIAEYNDTYKGFGLFEILEA